MPEELLERSLDLGLDREGRFRVSELFCFDTSWKAVVEQLLGLADAVLLDLRGFVPARTGTAHELRRLAEWRLLPRVVAIRDQGTDWDFVRACVVGDGQGEESFALVIDAGEEGATRRCLDTLIAVADQPRIGASVLAESA